MTERKILPEEPSNLLKQLEDIKDDYDSMIEKSNDLIGEKLLFYLKSSDINIEDVFENSQHISKLWSIKADLNNIFRSVDLLNTKFNDSGAYYAYNSFYNGQYNKHRYRYYLYNDFYFIPVNDGDEE